MRIRCRRDPEALDDADARLVTFQVLGVNPSVEQDTGEMRVLAEHSQSVPTMDNILLDPGISIMAVSTVIAKQVNVDYWGGWSYIGTDAYGLTTA
jgi:16S rRNA C1402 N4-methylase RsmH